MDLNEKIDAIKDELNNIKTLFAVHEAREKATLKAVGAAFIILNAALTIGLKFLS